jgi:transposase
VLIQQYLDESYAVEYSIPSCRRLLNQAGLSYQKPRQAAAESDVDEQDPFREGPEKSGGKWTPQ